MHPAPAMAKAAGTVFINRDRKEAAEQKRLFEERLKLGHKLMFFPEGTSSDSLRVLPFKPTLFAAFFAPELRDEVTPKNILMIGPTGVGKTEIARRLARLASAPFIKVEATKFTEVGYVGRDVDSIIRDLMEFGMKQVREAEKEKVRQRALDNAEDRILDALLPPARDFNEDSARDNDSLVLYRLVGRSFGLATANSAFKFAGYFRCGNWRGDLATDPDPDGLDGRLVCDCLHS